MGRRFSGMALWPFLIVKDKALLRDPVFINHERIHLRQQAELLVLPFYIWYGVEFMIRWLQHKNTYLAYRSISFEREAYAQERSFSYLKTRKMWCFTGFL
jgi:hypothetical protein